MSDKMSFPVAMGIIALVVVCFLVILLSVAYQQQQIRPPEEFNKTIQVKAIYPRVDAYMNHNPPYIITKGGEVYDVPDSLVWAKFDVGGNYKVRYSIVKISGKTGEIHGIEEFL